MEKEMSKSYTMLIPANDVVTPDKAGVDAMIAENPEAYAEGTQIKLGLGDDTIPGPPTAANDAEVFIVLSTKVVGIVVTPLVII
jgi:hypothetical protein